MRYDRLDDWLAWQSTIHSAEIELGLQRINQVWCRLRPKGLACQVVTVAGTNGKGSCVAMLESIYLQAGYRVGAYTSPHLSRYNERVRIQGCMVSDQQLCQAFERVDQARQQVALTYFEFGTLAALDIFADAGLDLLILEVGLGGRLDAVNIIDPDVALITTVDLDHLDWLGTTREEIGLEKAGIMRAGKPVVLAHEMPESVYRQARELATDEYRWGQHFQFELTRSGFSWTGGRHRYHNLPRPALPGACQVQNAAAVLMVCECLSAKLSVDEAAISRGLQTVRLPGRMQILPGRPRIILDVAHNPQAVQNLVDNLSAQSLPGSLHAVFGILSDKDLAAIVQIIAPRLMSWHLVDTPGPRGQSAEQLKCRLTTLGVEHNIHACGSLDRALKSATEQAGQDASILIFGSFLVVGDFLNSLNKQALN